MNCPAWCDDHFEYLNDCSFHQSAERALHGWEFLLVAPYPESPIDTIDDPGVFIYKERDGFPATACTRDEADAHLAEFRRQTESWGELVTELERAISEVWG